MQNSQPDPLRTSRSRLGGFLPGVRARATALAAATLALATAASSAAAAAPVPRLKSPRLAELARAGSAIVDSTLTPARTRTLAATLYWGGTFTARTGEAVTIRVSDSYPQDPTIPQRWADFLASLVHGPELSRVTAFLAPLDEVQQVCGARALACYTPQRELLVAPGDDPSGDISAESVVAHEYGHHVAANRDNAPWDALDYGAKRWATAENVCARTSAGGLFPGAESDSRYRLNPGEGWAESYRLLNERVLAIPETPWDVVDQSLFPSNAALTALQQDVTSPWTAPTTSSYTATLRRGSQSRSIATPLDGSLAVTLRAPARARFAVDLFTGGKRVAHAVAARAALVRTTVCGTRSYSVKVTRLAGAGSYSVSVVRP